MLTSWTAFFLLVIVLVLSLSVVVGILLTLDYLSKKVRGLLTDTLLERGDDV